MRHKRISGRGDAFCAAVPEVKGKDKLSVWTSMSESGKRGVPLESRGRGFGQINHKAGSFHHR